MECRRPRLLCKHLQAGMPAFQLSCFFAFFINGLCFGFYFAGVYVSTKQHRLPNIYRPSGAAK